MGCSKSKFDQTKQISFIDDTKTINKTTYVDDILNNHKMKNENLFNESTLMHIESTYLYSLSTARSSSRSLSRSISRPLSNNSYKINTKS